MTTRTSFALVGDNEDTSYPSDEGYPLAVSQKLNDQALDRYSQAGLVKEGESAPKWQYPSGNDGFNVPLLKFTFLDAYANRVRVAPTILIKMPNTFNISNFSEYSRTDNIFGAGSTFYDLSQSEFQRQQAIEGFNAADFGLTAGEAVKIAVQRGFAGVQGFLGSAGMNNIAQFEFDNRSAVNPFAQMLYKGPQYRRYQVPVIMKPKNAIESENIRKIISAFRVASSPSVPSTSGVSPGGELSIGLGSTFTFGYPHLTQFDVTFRGPKGSGFINIFRSKPCAIESVTVDYGGQKLTFFEDGMPTEINFTLQLTEILPRTLGDARTDARDPNRRMV